MKHSSIFSEFNNKNVRIWIKGGKEYFGTLKVLKEGEVCTISREGNSAEVHALIRDISVIRIEILHTKKNNFAENNKT